MKQYRFIADVVFYFVGYWYRLAYYRACPACMRQLVIRHSLLNLIPANVLWPVVVLPWALGLIAASTRRGHSPSVIDELTPELLEDAETAANARASRQGLAVLALLFCWWPIFGLGLALGAWLVNRKAADWKRTTSRIALILSSLIHLTLLVLIVRKG